jgi:hypothetical protein
LYAGQRSPDPLQLEFTHRFDLHGILDRDQHTRVNEDLSRLGLEVGSRNIVTVPTLMIIALAFRQPEPIGFAS